MSVSQRYHLCHDSVEVESPCNTHSEFLWDDRDMARACVPLISGCGTIQWTDETPYQWFSDSVGSHRQAESRCGGSVPHVKLTLTVRARHSSLHGLGPAYITWVAASSRVRCSLSPKRLRVAFCD